MCNGKLNLDRLCKYIQFNLLLLSMTVMLFDELNTTTNNDNNNSLKATQRRRLLYRWLVKSNVKKMTFKSTFKNIKTFGGCNTGWK